MKTAAINQYKKELLLAVLFLLTLLFGMQPLWIEKIYSTGIYLFISKLQRICWGWIPGVLRT